MAVATQMVTRVNEPEAPTQPAGRNRRPSAPLDTGDRYVIGPQLGRGGMGEVVAAHDTRIGREIAIKRLHDDDPGPVALARFLREARIQGRLDHPAIPPVHELDHDADGRPFFAMKKLSGHTLAEALRDPELRPKFPRQRLLRAFVDVCLAIEFAHNRGVIHRDIKPSNVLLGEYGEVYVLDWGVARMVNGEPEIGVTVAGAALGTPGYMSPEQIRGRIDVDARADVYALGCILYEILAGTTLHPRGDAALMSALHPVDARPSTRADDVPPELDALCVAATALDREARVPSARALGDAVQAYLDGDRDFELRSRIAREHLATAEDALDLRDDETTRRTALREAGRALALDPDLIPAAELIGRLMVSPMPVTPAPVVDELDALDREEASTYARVTVLVHAGYFALAIVLSILYKSGPTYTGLLTLIAIATTALGLATMRDPRPLCTRLLIASNIATIALFARMFSPFLVAPGIGVITLMRVAFHPAAHRKMLIRVMLGSLAAILGVWLAEVVGLLSPTMLISGGTMHIHAAIPGLDAVPGAPAMCMYTITLFVVASVMSYTSAQAQRLTRHRLHVQAWQLRQLVSVPTSSSEP
jgi:serine/threonine-protein kinase